MHPTSSILGSSLKRLVLCVASLRSKRFQSSYCAKVRAEAKKAWLVHFFLLLSQFSR